MGCAMSTVVEVHNRISVRDGHLFVCLPQLSDEVFERFSSSRPNIRVKIALPSVFNASLNWLIRICIIALPSNFNCFQIFYRCQLLFRSQIFLKVFLKT